MITVFAQDLAFGAGNHAAVNQVIGQGTSVNRLLVPLSAQDFTLFAQQAKQANLDLLFVAWPRHDGARDVARARAAGRLRRLEQDYDWPARACRLDRVRRRRRSTSSHYVATAPKNKVNDFVNAMRANQQGSTSTPDGLSPPR